MWNDIKTRAGQRLDYFDPGTIPDIIATDLVDVQDLGHCLVRYVYTVLDSGIHTVACRLVMPSANAVKNRKAGIAGLAKITRGSSDDPMH